MWDDLVLGVLATLAVAWLALIGALLAVRPKGATVAEAGRLLPDLLRLVRDVATDRKQPRSVRLRLALMAGYLALPIDLVPDVLPVIGYADDVIVVIWTLRSVVRDVGLDELRRHWRGSSTGFAAVCRVAGLAPDGERPASLS
jgi:uncharacterized membrane protein YkvA (DUF1232 family)